MNIMYLDRDPSLCAQALHDLHLKGVMPKEAVQILSTALRVIGWDIGYKQYNPNGRFVKWVLSSLANYEWLYQYVEACNHEHRHRFGKDHYSYAVFLTLPRLYQVLIPYKPDKTFTDPPLAMRGMEKKYTVYTCREYDDVYKCREGAWMCGINQNERVYCDYRQLDTVASYRAYYAAEKQHDKNGKPMDTYTNRERPDWMGG